LEITGVVYSIRRVDVDHLNLPGHALFFKKGVHHKQGITSYEPIAPIMFVLIKLNSFPEWVLFRLPEQ
jgi:hypothetical protein